MPTAELTDNGQGVGRDLSGSASVSLGVLVLSGHLKGIG